MRLVELKVATKFSLHRIERKNWYSLSPINPGGGTKGMINKKIAAKKKKPQANR